MFNKAGSIAKKIDRYCPNHLTTYNFTGNDQNYDHVWFFKSYYEANENEYDDDGYRTTMYGWSVKSIKMRPAKNINSKNKKVEELYEYITDKRKIKFEYTDDDRISLEYIEPLSIEIIVDRDKPVLHGYCLNFKKEKSFKIHKMSEIRVVDSE